MTRHEAILMVAANINDDFSKLPQKVKEAVAGRPMPELVVSSDTSGMPLYNSDSYAYDYASWLSDGIANWRYMIAVSLIFNHPNLYK